MSMDGINGDFNKALEALKTGKVKEGGEIQQLPQKIQIKMNKFEGGEAQKKVTQEVINKALNEPSAMKAAKGLLNSSPVGLGQQPTREEIEKMGYSCNFAKSQYHLGAPVIFESQDGGTITVYDGKGTAEMGEDKRKIVYENGLYTQETFYDEKGNVISCEIRIKSDVTGLTEPNGRFTLFYNENGKLSVIR